MAFGLVFLLNFQLNQFLVLEDSECNLLQSDIVEGIVDLNSVQDAKLARHLELVNALEERHRHVFFRVGDHHNLVDVQSFNQVLSQDIWSTDDDVVDVLDTERH